MCIVYSCLNLAGPHEARYHCSIVVDLNFENSVVTGKGRILIFVSRDDHDIRQLNSDKIKYPDYVLKRQFFKFSILYFYSSSFFVVWLFPTIKFRITGQWCHAYMVYFTIHSASNLSPMRLLSDDFRKCSKLQQRTSTPKQSLQIALNFVDKTGNRSVQCSYCKQI